MMMTMHDDDHGDYMMMGTRVGLGDDDIIA